MDLLDFYKLDFLLYDYVDRSVGSVEANGTLTFSRPFQRLIVEAFDFPCLLQTNGLHETNPGRELLQDLSRHGSKVFLSLGGEDDPSNHTLRYP